MALPVVLDCHSSLLVVDNAGGATVNGSVVLGRLFAHLPTLIADVNVAKLKNVKDKPNLLETDKVRPHALTNACLREWSLSQAMGRASCRLTASAMCCLCRLLLCQILFTYQFRETHSKYHVMVSYHSTSRTLDSALLSECTIRH